MADQLGALAKELRKAGHMVIAEGDVDAFKSYNELAQEMKAGGTGIVLQPDEYDGEALFKTPFPRLSRADFPPGRGMYAHRGRAYRVQLPVPV
jgi:S-DNA-T family DNA segregation ATPase FtsK/SpoIIIE